MRNSLRMRPDRIVVGECAAARALDMLQAMNTGHEGSISTVHANSPRDAIARLETLVLMAGMDLPLRAIREQIASAIDIIVQIARLQDGIAPSHPRHRGAGHGGRLITLQDAFVFDYAAGIDDEGRFLRPHRPTGVRPRFADRFADLGIALPMSLFQPDLRRDARRDPMNAVLLVGGVDVGLLALLVARVPRRSRRRRRASLATPLAPGDGACLALTQRDRAHDRGIDCVAEADAPTFGDGRARARRHQDGAVGDSLVLIVSAASVLACLASSLGLANGTSILLGDRVRAARARDREGQS